MTRYYAIDEANAALPEVERILAALRDQREELIALRDRVVAASPPDDETPPPAAAEQIRLLRLGHAGPHRPDAGRRRAACRDGHHAAGHLRRASSTSPRSSAAARSGCAGASAKPPSSTGTRTTRASTRAARSASSPPASAAAPARPRPDPGPGPGRARGPHARAGGQSSIQCSMGPASPPRWSLLGPVERGMHGRTGKGVDRQLSGLYEGAIERAVHDLPMSEPKSRSGPRGRSSRAGARRPTDRSRLRSGRRPCAKGSPHTTAATGSSPMSSSSRRGWGRRTSPSASCSRD